MKVFDPLGICLFPLALKDMPSYQRDVCTEKNGYQRLLITATLLRLIDLPQWTALMQLDHC